MIIRLASIRSTLRLVTFVLRIDIWASRVFSESLVYNWSLEALKIVFFIPFLVTSRL